MSEEKSYPTPYDFLINLPLYETVDIDKENLRVGWNLKYFDKSIDVYCPKCCTHSIFNRFWRSGRHTNHDMSAWVNSGRFILEFQCSRDSEHKLFFLFTAIGRTIQKIGQFPSLATLNLFDVKKYSKVLPPAYFKELTKAIGLAAHGIGVGSFVYLRRIFELLIEEAHLKCQELESWDTGVYAQSRMNQKIKLLSSELPSFLVENRSMYSILSKGIHELTEQECLAAFPVVKVGIEIILDSKLEELHKAKKIEQAQKAISQLSSQI